MRGPNLWTVLVLAFSVFVYLSVRQIVSLYKSNSPATLIDGLLNSSAPNAGSTTGTSTRPVLPPAAAGHLRAASYRRPIVISIQNQHFLGSFGYNSLTDTTKGPCHADGIRLNCR